MIQRTFHPIGQGAFYTERHDNFNIVYDCGNWKRSKLSSHIVQQSFKSSEVIDILFISHFDADHVNKIVVLKDHCRSIRNVVLPLLHEDEKRLLTQISNILKQHDVSQLINDTQAFFGDDTNVIFVQPTDSPEGSQGNEVNIENLNKIPGTNITTIPSNSSIFSQAVDWFYVPYNYNYTSRNTELENLFLKYGLDITQFRNDLNYALVNRAKIKSIYNAITGQINQNSMMVYSGPTGNNYKIIETYHHSFFYRQELNRVGCIYTGDVDFNIVNIRNVFSQYWDKVGTIQIPHHGDIKCFNTNFFDGKHYYCPMSVGTKNSYGHPSSSVISSILSNNSIPFQITEMLNSGLIQIISN